MKKFTKSELFAIEVMSGMVDEKFAKDLNTKVRKMLNMSLPISEDNGCKNVARCIMREAAKTKGKEEGVADKKWVNFVARHVKKFLNGNGLTADEELVRLLGSGNAKEFYTKYPTAKYYEELYAAVQTWLTTKTPPTEINILDYVLGVLLMLLNFIDGKFGKRVLKRKFRIVWRFVTYGTIAYLTMRFVFIPLLEWWDGVVHFINYLVWGC